LPRAGPRAEDRLACLFASWRRLSRDRAGSAWWCASRAIDTPGASAATLTKRALTSLSDERPIRLDLAHRRVNEAVLDAYGWPHDLSDERNLACLLALNLE
jgi:hypothetical protein